MSVQRCRHAFAWVVLSPGNKPNICAVFYTCMSLTLPQNCGSRCHHHYFADEETDAQRGCPQSETAQAGLTLLPAGWKIQAFLTPPQPSQGCWILEWERQDGRKPGGEIAKWGIPLGWNGIERNCSAQPISIPSRLLIISYFLGNISQVRNFGIW